MTNVQRLIADTAEKCITNKIDFLLKKTPTVLAEDTIECSGYFDEKSLVVATGDSQENWLPILIHESGHLDQYIEKISIWQDGESSIDSIDAWLKGKPLHNRDIVKCFKSVIKLELDCEKRTIKKIKKYKLDIDKNLYIQKANAYLFSYWATFRNKKWFPFPYNNPHIYSCMPKKFLKEEEYLKKDTKFLNFFVQ